MNTPCPHCSALIEFDPATHASPTGQSHFACPVCQIAVSVPVIAKPRLQLNPAPASHATAPVNPAQYPKNAPTASRWTNRNLLILGSAVLLILGGLAFVLARRGGNIFNSEQNIRNEIVNNSYFQNLIATGVTTMKDLDAIAEIGPYEDGFIGISKESLNREQAEELARLTGSEILDVEDVFEGSRPLLQTWLGNNFSSHLSSPVWVSIRGEVRVLDGVDILATAAGGSQRKVLLVWSVIPTNDSGSPSIAQAARKNVFFIKNGQPLAIIESGSAWLRAKDYMENTGTGNILYARQSLGEGDFRITARFSLKKLDRTAASLVFGGNHFGFDGRNNGQRLFLEGPDFPQSRSFGLTAAHIEAGRIVQAEIIRKGTNLTLQLGDEEIATVPFRGGGIGQFGLRPWRATMRVEELSVSGNLMPMLDQPSANSQ